MKKRSRTLAPSPKPIDYKARSERLALKLEEAEDTLRAIQSGEVDALVVGGPAGERVFTLKSTDQPYRVLVETMSEGAVTLNSEGVVFYCNQRFAEMLRLPLENVMGTAMVEFIPAPDREAFRACFMKAQAGRSMCGVDLQAASGTRVRAHLSMSTVETEDGRGVCLIATDLTEQKRFEEARADVERLNMERELRERFVSTLSHDLRNPLSSVKTSAQMILRHPEKVDRHAALGTRILHSVERADKMIQDLLDANLIRAGERLPLVIRECDLSATVRMILEELSLAMGERFVMEDESPVIGYWSSEQLTRVIENLATNAIKYGAPQTMVRVAVKAAEQSVWLAVHNHGPGLTPEEQAGLFNPYSRTRSALNSGQKGWGLGLTLVRGVAEAHGGEVSVESSPGSGTTFTVRLPRDSRPFQHPDGKPDC